MVDMLDPTLSAALAQQEARKVAKAALYELATETRDEVSVALSDVARAQAKAVADMDQRLAAAADRVTDAAREAAAPVARETAQETATERIPPEVAAYMEAHPVKAGVDGDPGRPGLVWRGPWKKGTVYAEGDGVSSDGSSYIATTSVSLKPPSKGWDLLAQRGEDGSSPGRSWVPRGPGGGSAGGGSITVSDEGVALDAAVTSIDFVGAGVAATNVGHAVTVTIEQTVYVQASDPGAVGSGKLGVDTTTPGPPWHVRVRNAADDGWEPLNISSSDVEFAATGYAATNVNAAIVNETLYRLQPNTTWAGLTPFASGATVLGSAGGGFQHVFQSSGGTSDVGEPDWSSAYGGTVADGDIFWTDLGINGRLGYSQADFALHPGSIADPTTATAEDVANKVNELMAAMSLVSLLKTAD